MLADYPLAADTHLSLSIANPRWYSITGLGDGPLAEWLDCVVPEDVKKIENIWRLATSGGEASDASDRQVRRTVYRTLGAPSALPDAPCLWQFRFKNGRVAVLEIRASSEEGVPNGYVGALTDITRQKEIELLHLREVERRAADAEENRKQTEAFLGEPFAFDFRL